VDAVTKMTFHPMTTRINKYVLMYGESQLRGEGLE